MNKNTNEHIILKISLYSIFFISGVIIGLSIGIIYFKGSWIFLNSNFLISFATFSAPLIAVGIIVYFGLRQYFIQQKVTHLRKIYFEDTLLKVNINLEKGEDASRRLLASLVEALNIIMNLINQRIINKNIFISSLESIKDNMYEFIPFSDIAKSRVEEIFEKQGFLIVKWIEKAENDFINFAESARGQLTILINNFKAMSNGLGKLDRKLIEKLEENLKNQKLIFERHYALVSLFSEIISKYIEFDYKNIDELKSFSESEIIKPILEKIEKIFFTLFACYKTKDENVCYSYALDENDNRFKITKENGKLKITREKVSENHIDLENWVPYEDDRILAESYIEDTKNNYIDALIGLVNMILEPKRSDFNKKIAKF